MASAPAKYDMAVYPLVVAVRSASDGADVHQVHLPHCDCADFTNRKGRRTATSDGAPAVTICKHLVEALERVGGWHREAPPADQAVYPDVSRAQAMTVLTSSYISADLSRRLLSAAMNAQGIAASIPITTGHVFASYDSVTRHYALSIPASQPVALPANF